MIVVVPTVEDEVGSVRGGLGSCPPRFSGFGVVEEEPFEKKLRTHLSFLDHASAAEFGGRAGKLACMGVENTNGHPVYVPQIAVRAHKHRKNRTE